MDCIYLPHVESTNTWALDALEAGRMAAPFLVVAHAQTQGRGRLGRTWRSVAGRSLTMTFVPQNEGARAPVYAIATALAVREAVRQLTGVTLSAKWPNDLMFGRAKVCGILIESRSQAGRPAPHVAIGIGLNANLRTEDLPRLGRNTASSLLLIAKKEIDLYDLADTIVLELQDTLEPRQEARWRHQLSTDYANALGLIGREVSVRSGQATHAGTLAALTIDGGVVLATTEGDLALPLETVQALEPPTLEAP